MREPYMGQKATDVAHSVVNCPRLARWDVGIAPFAVWPPSCSFNKGRDYPWASDNERKILFIDRRGNTMKDKVGLLVPVVLILCGVYILLISIGSSGEQVAVFARFVLPRG